MRWLTAVPVYNEERNIPTVLPRIRPFAAEILLINDGSTDRTGELIARESGVRVIHHERNRGYGGALISAFAYAIAEGFDALITIDSDGQHDPSFLPTLIEELHDCDIVSGSRYLKDFERNDAAPNDRLWVNRQITREINERWHLGITDAFCGYKAYRCAALTKLAITETGWGMPLQLWVQAARRRLRIKEVAVPRIYLDPTRSFGGVLNDADERLAYYRRVLRSAENDPLPTDRCKCGRIIPQWTPCCVFCNDPVITAGVMPASAVVS